MTAATARARAGVWGLMPRMDAIREHQLRRAYRRLGDDERAMFEATEESSEMKLQIVPIDFDEAVAFVRQFHRHHKPPIGHKFSVGCSDGEKIVGVAIVGRPVARHLDDGWTLEVTRLCTDGTKNACSMLYAAAWRVAKNLGYRTLITYILGSEKGTSLKASGWRLVGVRGGGSWSVPSRPRVDKHPLQKKLLFEVSVD